MRRYGLAYIIALVCVAADGAAAAGANDGVSAGVPITQHAVGLLVGFYNPGEPVAATPEEAHLALRPHQSISQEKPYWLFVPAGYDEGKRLPLVIVLHERRPLRSFSTGMRFDETHLRTYAGKALARWKDTAEKENFLLMVPFGDPDMLWMGISWFTGDRGVLLQSQIETVAATHSVDRRRVYLVASGEGGHAAIATAVRNGGLLAAACACNPPLFERPSGKKNLMSPESADEMVPHAGTRKPPLLILAGDVDKVVGIRTHSHGAVKAVRYQDDGSIPSDFIKKAGARLSAAGFEIDFRTVPTKHFAPLPAGLVPDVWAFLKRHSIPADMQTLPGVRPVPVKPARTQSGK